MKKRLSRLVTIFLLVLVLNIGSFLAGMAFYARVYCVPVAAASLPSEMPPEFATFWEAWSFLDEQFYGDIPPDKERASVQIPHTLADGSELRVTIAEWLTPAGRQIHDKGITPDIAVEITLEDYEQKRDPQLDRAVEFLQAQRIEKSGPPEATESTGAHEQQHPTPQSSSHQ